MRRAWAATARLPWWIPPLAAGIALRSLGLLHDSTIDTDGAYYGAVTRWFAAGHFAKALDPVWPPALPFAASLFVRAGLPVEAAGVAVSFLSSVVAIALVAAVARAVAGRHAARFAAWLAAVHPKFVGFGLQFLTESLYIACTAAALWACVARRRASGAIGAGAALGAAFLTRPEAVALVPAACAFVAWRGAATSRARGAAHAALCAGAFAVMVGPYLAHVARIEGRFTLGEKGALNFHLAHRDGYARAGIDVRRSDFAAITAPDTERLPGDYRVGAYLRREPGAVILHALANIPPALGSKIPGLVGWPLFALALWGACGRRARVPRAPGEWLFAAWIGMIVLSIVPLFLYRRFFAATLPPLLVWAAIAVVELIARGGRPARFAAWTGVALLAAASQWSVWRTDWPRAYRDAGTWLAAHAPPPRVLAGRKPETSFYAAAQFRPLPSELAAVDSLRGALRGAGATHFVADDYVLPRSHPALGTLLDVANAPPWLVPVHTASRDGHRVVVYAFVER